MKKIKLKGNLMFLEEGKTGVKYDETALKKAMEEFQEKIGEGVFGAMDQTYSVMNLEDITHKVKGVEMGEGLDYTADIEILDTPKGMLLQKMLEQGVGVTTSVRGIGDEEHLEIFSIDLMGM